MLSGQTAFVSMAGLGSNTELVLHVLTRCGEEDGNDGAVPVLVLRIPRSDGGCVPEPTVYVGCIE
jgi:hypothetical protein